jgi:hypothetical protein
MSNVSNEEVKKFSEHCLLMRSVYRYMVRLFKDSNPTEHALMNAVAPQFFGALMTVFSEYMVLAVCRITDPADAGQGKENFTVELFAKNFAPDTEAFKKLAVPHKKMELFRAKIKRARHKLAAHADRAAVSGPPLMTASWREWEEFWSALKDFVRILNEETLGAAFDIDPPGASNDAEKLLTALKK